MDDQIVITVHYKGADRDFEAALQVFGYSHRFLVSVEGAEVFFERDEEGRYRAYLPPEQGTRQIDAALLQAVAAAIEDILK